MQNGSPEVRVKTKRISRTIAMPKMYFLRTCLRWLQSSSFNYKRNLYEFQHFNDASKTVIGMVKIILFALSQRPLWIKIEIQIPTEMNLNLFVYKYEWFF